MNKMENYHIPTTPSSSKLRMAMAISTSTSFLAVPRASANECMQNDGEACCSAESEASLGDNSSTQIDQDNVSLRKSQMICSGRQKREPIISYSPSHASTYNKITHQASGLSITDPEERTTGDQRGALTCVCEAFFSAPCRAEVEEFFAEAEQYEQKLPTARYNFDFQNDVPLQGRYEWISLNQC
ncbi:hypothetical protein O6H91_17G072000 [Diphasiastrum complanatum]|uniref:Uncharacterized protein n=1 Tax=Diphasiastrum complanatum TaxID=34168 RepID=A0ACC2B8X7_DIPCM|nr:hypothetical protein O6H91_17G072000 [Diphasiastrum complanatum]